jgi:hypothetical protein
MRVAVGNFKLVCGVLEFIVDSAEECALEALVVGFSRLSGFY